MLENASIHGCEHNDAHADNNQNRLRHHCWSQDLIQSRHLLYLSAQSRTQVEICQKAILSIWMRVQSYHWRRSGPFTVQNWQSVI